MRRADPGRRKPVRPRLAGNVGKRKAVRVRSCVPAGSGSPRSIESSRRVSRSIALTASHDDSAATSTVRSSASGEPTANS